MPLPHLVRFDWSMKRLLRHKSNFIVLEGFLCSLLEIARNMKSLGIAVDVIAQMTGLSAGEIKRL